MHAPVEHKELTLLSRLAQSTADQLALTRERLRMTCRSIASSVQVGQLSMMEATNKPLRSLASKMSRCILENPSWRLGSTCHETALRREIFGGFDGSGWLRIGQDDQDWLEICRQCCRMFGTRLSSMTSIAGPGTMPWILEVFSSRTICRSLVPLKPLQGMLNLSKSDSTRYDCH